MTRVMVIAPHPDDEVLGCGGAIARHTARGDHVRVVVVTRGIPELFAPADIEATRAELSAAHRLLGVEDTVFLDFPAPRLDTLPSHEISDALRKRIYETSPDLIYLPHRGDIHVDHKIVYWATLVAARPTPGRRSPTLWCYETLSETEWGAPTGDEAFVPNVYVDIGAHLQQKLDAMAMYASQLKPAPQSRSLRSIEALARVRGGTVNLDAAEAFMLVRQVVD